MRFLSQRTLKLIFRVLGGKWLVADDGLIFVMMMLMTTRFS